MVVGRGNSGPGKKEKPFKREKTWRRVHKDRWARHGTLGRDHKPTEKDESASPVKKPPAEKGRKEGRAITGGKQKVIFSFLEVEPRKKNEGWHTKKKELLGRTPCSTGQIRTA